MGMLMHRHLDESTKKPTQKAQEAPSVVEDDHTATAEEKPVKTPSKPVKRVGRGRTK